MRFGQHLAMLNDPANGLDRSKLIDLPAPASPLMRGLLRGALRPIEWLTSIDRVNELYSRIGGNSDWREFLRRVLESLNVSYSVLKQDLQRIPKSGPLVVVANHPFGAIEGLILAEILSSIRPDVKIMANHLLRHIPQMRDLFIFVDPFGGVDAARRNSAPLRQALRLLKSDGMLGIFPAGEVASFNLAQRSVQDPPWKPMIARLIRSAEVPVLPIYFGGRNSMLFQLLGLVHPRLRTAMLARELFNKAHQQIDIRIGSPISWPRLAQIPDDQELIEYLHGRTCLLAQRGSEPIRTRPQRRLDPIVAPQPAASQAAELRLLPPDSRLIETSDFDVHVARAEDIPCILREIGRLREITFRATGEGSGRSIDLDRFDQTYLHLFVWSKQHQQLAGAYRLGLTDVLTGRHGVSGLYTHTLFDYDRTLLEQIGPAIELGRSFVRPEFQRSFAPLLLLWKGICRFACQNPQYRNLFGPVSISNEYQTISRQLMVRFLQENHRPDALSKLVRPRNPFQGCPAGRTHQLIIDSDDLSDVVAELESDQKGIPVLLRQYLKLGAQLLAFNIDPQFSDVVDGLILVDLTRAEPRIIERYMGRDARQQFVAWHARQPASNAPPL